MSTPTIKALSRTAQAIAQAEVSLIALQTTRAKYIQQAHDEGLAYRAIAPHAGVSHQRVAQIVTAQS